MFMGMLKNGVKLTVKVAISIVSVYVGVRIGKAGVDAIESAEETITNCNTKAREARNCKNVKVEFVYDTPPNVEKKNSEV